MTYTNGEQKFEFLDVRQSHNFYILGNTLNRTSPLIKVFK